jgi:hypothetical protein
VSAVLAAGCVRGLAGPAPDLPPARLPAACTPAAGPAAPAAVAAAFLAAWATVDAAAGGRCASPARYAALVTPALGRRLARWQPSPGDWREMRADWLSSIVTVTSITRPFGVRAPSPGRAWLLARGIRVTTTASGPPVTSPVQVVLELTSTGRRWLVSAIWSW